MYNMLTLNSRQAIFARKHLTSISIMSIWIVVAIVVFFQSTVAMWLNCQPDDRFTTLIICCGWLFWSLLTPVVTNIVRRIEARQVRLSLEFAMYAGFSILFVAVHILLQMFLYNLTLQADCCTFRLPDYIIYHIHTQFVAFFFIVFVLKGISYYKSYGASKVREEKLNTELINSRLEALKMQLNPHFLFNTHHSIISLMTKNDTKKATEMLMKLSDFLRLTLDNTKQLTSLSDELKLMKFYLDIQQVRFEDKLFVRLEAQSEVLNAAIPSFIMQPLIENAIIHGIAPYAEPSTLNISCNKVNDLLEIEVYDNGGGIEIDRFKEGIGVKNIRARLKELYGDRAGVSVLPHRVKGTVSKIWIPFSEYKDAGNG